MASNYPVLSEMFRFFWSPGRFLLLPFLLVFLLDNSYAQPKRYSFSQQKMGGPFNIILYADDSIRAEAVALNCFLLTDSLVSIFSDYLDSSELNRLSASAGRFNQPFIVSPALLDILLIAQRAWLLSQGSFDITLGPLTRLWRKARKENKWPSAQQISEKLALTGFDKVSIDSQNRVVLLKKPGMLLDLGGIAQGYIAQQVINRIKLSGLNTALVDVSGDICTLGKPPLKNGFVIAVNLPEQTDQLMPKHLLINNLSVTTSGDTYQYLLHGGKKYSHVLNPATGLGLTNSRNVTVIAGDGTTADWFTKACSLLPLPAAKKLAKTLHAEFMIAEVKNNRLVTYQSENFASYWQVNE
jgi:FAD:protein FMN transferase